MERRLYEAGETVLKASPYAAVVLDEQAETHCHACYSPLAAASTVRCSDCKFARYCSDACLSQDPLHKEECQFLREVRGEKRVERMASQHVIGCSAQQLARETSSHRD